MTPHQCRHDNADPGMTGSRGAELLAALRRRQASWRCEPLPSGHRDPWRPWRPAKLSERQVDGAAAAARHLRDAGCPPLFDVATLRAMWRAGHHRLVDDLRGVGR